MRIIVGSKSYRPRSYWHAQTFQETDTGRTVVVLKRSWPSLRFRLVFPSGESLRSSSISRANFGGRLSLSDERGVVIDVFPSDGAPPAGVRDQRRNPSMHVVVYREGIPDLLLVIVLAVNSVRETQIRAYPSAPGAGG
jgi:hypothetical protein